MEFTSKKILLEHIDTADRSFCARMDTDNRALKESIEQTGVINSPYLIFSEASEKYKIICGFKRIRAVLALGWDEINVNIVSPDAADRDLFLLALNDNLSGALLNPVEKAGAVKGLLEYFPEETVIKKYLPLLDMSPGFACLEESLLISGLEPEIKQGLASGTLAKKSAIRLSRIGEDGILLFRLFSAVNLSTSKQADIIENCCDISKRDNLSISEIINAQQIRETLSNDDLTLSQKGNRIRHYLRIKRFPRLSRIETTFLKLQKSLGLPQNIRFEPPLSFEGDVYSLQINLRSLEELKTSAAHVIRLSESPQLQALLEKKE